MSREIRPVALDWEHPRDGDRTYSDGSIRYFPLHSREDLLFRIQDQEENPGDYDGDEEINLDDYMPELPEGTPYGWQMYETVTEGSPISPIFTTKDELAEWLASPDAGQEQVSQAAARAFVADGWAPTFIDRGNGLLTGVESAGRDSR
jgi:hypothetical protein